jgi:hypothetical protein
MNMHMELIEWLRLKIGNTKVLNSLEELNGYDLVYGIWFYIEYMALYMIYGIVYDIFDIIFGIWY